ncbi:MAG: ribulose-phosphate 3-epimerase [Fastidiosipilaceae bacterium]|jgi:ribulose-phosphate 3-epimerase|nr:ribulose-phosphate 3-epimerase [Clostridiaceae bacterium]
MKLKPYAECKDKVLISPSILSADFANLGEDIRKVSQDADTIHVDVMDGVFVPNLTIGMPVVKAIRPYTDLPIDCHLMVHDPTPFIEGFAEAGADLITVHAETCQHLHRVTQQIRQAGCDVGVVINPATSLSAVEEILDEVDMILLMSVNPGFGGQKYIESTTDKIRRLRQMMIERGIEAHIQVDGGIGTGNIKDVYEAGANCFVAGSSVYGKPDPVQAIRDLKAACEV